MAIELETPDQLDYNFYPVSNGVLNFKVRASNDAHVALTTGPGESDPMIEIFLGGWNNSKSIIRKNKTKPEKAEAQTPNVLNGSEFRGFWVRWYDGVVTVGNEGDAAAFLSWHDDQPFPISYAGVCTGWGATGSWIIEGGPEIKTADCLNYQFKPINSGSVDVNFKGPSNCHIALCSSKGESKPICELLLGGWNNSASVIRLNQTKDSDLRVNTPDLCSASNFTKFHIHWSNGHIYVRRDNHNGPIIIDRKDCINFSVAYIGVRTGWGATGKWQISIGGSSNGASSSGNKPQSVIPEFLRPFIDASSQIATNVNTMPVVPGFIIPNQAPSANQGGNWAQPGSGGAACWVPSSNGQIPPTALPGGSEADGEPMFVARATHEGALIPGKLVASHGVCYVAWGGAEHPHNDYEVLCGGGNWVRCQGANIPPQAVPAGETEDGEPLFVGRAHHEGSVTVGKVQPSHGVCYIPYGGQEMGFAEYEVLIN